jgi:hypothetical protein
MAGEDPSPLFTNKSNEKPLSEKMKEKFGTLIGVHRLDVASISDDYVKFVMQVLYCKSLRKCLKDQVPVGAIATTEKCIEGIQMN